MFRSKTGAGGHRVKTGRRARNIAALLALALIGGVTVGASAASAGDGSNPVYDGYGFDVNGLWFGTYRTDAGVIGACLDPGAASPDPKVGYDPSDVAAPNSAYLLWKYANVADGQTGAMLEYAIQTATDGVPHSGGTPSFSTIVTNIPDNQKKFNEMQKDAANNRGPYTVKVTMTQPTATNATGTANVIVLSAANYAQPNIDVTISETGSVTGASGTISTGSTGIASFPFSLPNSSSGTITASSNSLPPIVVSMLTHSPASDNYQRLGAVGRNSAGSGSAPAARPAAPNGHILVRKIDSNTGDGVAGATFDLHSGSASGSIVATLTSQAGGYTPYTSQPVGTYVAVETSAPTHFNRDAANTSGQVTSGGSSSVVMSDSEQGKVSIRKTDAQTHAGLAGAHFIVETKTGIILVPDLVSTSGTVTTDFLGGGVKVGDTVIIRETAAPAGYLTDSTNMFTVVTRDGSGPASKAPTNNEKSRVSVYKTDTQTKAALKGATFQAYIGSTIYDTGTTDRYGNWTSSLLPLKVGTTVFIRETKAPDTYLPTPIVTQVVTTRTGGGSAQSKRTNDEQSKVSALKTDAATGAPLKNVAFEVSQGGTVLDSGITNAGGIWTSRYLPVAVGTSVAIRETAAPAGYIVSPTAQTVVTTRTGAGTGTWKLQDPRDFGSVTVAKKDTVTRKIIPGVVFTAQVRKVEIGGALGAPETVTGGVTTGTENPAGHYTTSTTGRVTLDGHLTTPQLAYGDQIIFTEFAAAPGYVQPTTPLTITGTFGISGSLILSASNSPQRSVQISKTALANSAAVPGAGFTVCYQPAAGRPTSRAELAAETACSLPSGTGLINPIDKSNIDPTSMYLVDANLITDTSGTTGVSAKAQFAQIGDRMFMFETATPAGFEKSLTAAVTTITGAGWSPACSNTTGGRSGTGDIISCAFVDQETALGTIIKQVVLSGTSVPAPGFSPAGAHYLVKNVTRSAVIAADAGPTDANGKLSLNLPSTYVGDQVSFTEITAPPGTALNSTRIVGMVVAVPGGYAVQVAQDDVPITLTTSAATGAGKTVPIGGGIVIDTVTYTGLLVGAHYTLGGEAQQNNSGVAFAAGITAHTDFVPLTPNGTIEVSYTIPGSQQGHALVIFENLTMTGTSQVIASESDINDLDQTVYFPAVSTIAANQDPALGKVIASSSTTIDTATICSVQPNQSYVISGSGFARDSKGVSYPANLTSSARFDAADTSCHDYPVSFPIGSDVTAGSSVVFTESLYQVPAGQDKNTWVPTTSDTPVAAENDLFSLDQTVYFPAIFTTATDALTGSKNLTSGNISDLITYVAMPPGSSLLASGKLMVNDLGAPVDTGIAGSTAFTPASTSGTVTVNFTVAPTLAGDILVPFEWVAFAATPGTPIAFHTDITDVAQTVYFPSIVTTASNGNAALGKTVIAGGTLTDLITYRSVQPGQRYTSMGIFQVVDGTVATPTAIVGSVSFIPTAPNGSATVSFAVPAKLGALAGKKLVAFETMKQGAITVATHADINDAAQAVFVPQISTVASNGDTALGKTVTAGGTLVDDLHFSNLTVGQKYTDDGEFQLIGKNITPTGIKGSVDFIPTTTSGTVKVTFKVPAVLDPSLLGHKIVAFETVRRGNVIVAVHADATDAAQTVFVPQISTSASNGNPALGKIVTAGGTLVDDLKYSNLTVGQKYTNVGDFKILIGGQVTSTGIKGTVEFVPIASSGTIKVTFKVPAVLPAVMLGRRIVAFETVSLGGTIVAVHQNMDDAAQAVEVPMVSTTLTDEAGSKLGVFDDGKLIDVLMYRNLQPGVQFIVTSQLRIKNGTPRGAATNVTATTLFTASESGAGRADIHFQLNNQMSGAATYTVVAFESVAMASLPGTPIVVHQDMANEKETISLAHSSGGSGGGGGGSVTPKHSDGGGSINTGAGAGNRTGSQMILIGAGLLTVVLLLLGGGYFLIRRRRRA